MAGEPGNGKTLLARAVAGEANCSFLSISGSDFIEVLLGSVLQELEICFIRRENLAHAFFLLMKLMRLSISWKWFGGGYDEREQTLNQLLTEMDGFDQ